MSFSGKAYRILIDLVYEHSRIRLGADKQTLANLVWCSACTAVSTLFDDPTMKMASLSVAGFGIFGALPVFWTFPAAFLSGPAAAGGIALINSIGNLAGFTGPICGGPHRLSLPAATPEDC